MLRRFLRSCNTKLKTSCNLSLIDISDKALSNNNIMVSSTSACHSSKEKGSYVVASLGKSEKAINNTIRVSLDSSNTIEEIDILVSILDEIIGEIR